MLNELEGEYPLRSFLALWQKSKKVCVHRVSRIIWMTPWKPEDINHNIFCHKWQQLQGGQRDDVFVSVFVVAVAAAVVVTVIDE
jgi:hypothetical protein